MNRIVLAIEYGPLVDSAIPNLGRNMPIAQLCEIGRDVQEKHQELRDWPSAVAANAYIYYLNIIFEKGQLTPDEPNVEFIAFLRKILVN